MSEASQQESTSRALGIAFLVAFACALLVSAAAVGLRPAIRANLEAERTTQLVRDALPESRRGLRFEDLDAHVVELASGKIDNSLDASSFDLESASTSADDGVEIPRELDLARLRRRPTHAPVFLVRGADQSIDMIVLPVSGRGYQSILRAWLVLDGTAARVLALNIYQQGDTPGVGSRVEDPEWQAQWQDRPIYDDFGELRIGVATGSGADADSKYKVDSISGATRTARGVDGMVRFWLGEFGFGPFLQRIREGTL